VFSRCGDPADLGISQMLLLSLKQWSRNMKRIKFTKTNLEKLPHSIGKTPDRYFESRV
jgi:hypothetical protein